VPTSWLAPIIGYRNSSITIISEPEPTDVIPTTIPPIIPTTTVGTGRATTSCTLIVRRSPLRRSSTNRSTIAAAPTSSATPSATSIFC
jgi:hypothetical protein